MAVQQGRSECRPEAYPPGYVEDLNDARTMLADIFSILLCLLRSWCLTRPDSRLLQFNAPLHQFDEVGHLIQLTELRRLRNEILVFERFERVLILELRDEQFQKFVLTKFFRPGRRRRGSARRVDD